MVANEEDKNFVDDSTQIESQPSAYFALKNIEGSVSSAEEDAYSHSDVDDFIDSDVEAKNYVLPGFDTEEGDLEIDEFDQDAEI